MLISAHLTPTIPKLYEKAAEPEDFQLFRISPGLPTMFGAWESGIDEALT